MRATAVSLARSALILLMHAVREAPKPSADVTVPASSPLPLEELLLDPLLLPEDPLLPLEEPLLLPLLLPLLPEDVLLPLEPLLVDDPLEPLSCKPPSEPPLLESEPDEASLPVLASASCPGMAAGPSLHATAPTPTTSTAA